MPLHHNATSPEQVAKMQAFQSFVPRAIIDFDECFHHESDLKVLLFFIMGHES
jgi:hypothetical protein